MKKLLFYLCFLLTTATLMAQAPQRISYQSIIRDANNVVVASSAVRVKISLLRGTSTGPAVYVETHGITTNANGLVSLNIGEGTAITGTFAGIDWSNGPYLIQTATDPTGGTDYSIIGIAPLNSVPYALNAANASVATTLAGTLAIANGGTGATTATAARAALGLENVDNTSDANKPVSTATQNSLATKVDKVTGKELSTNDYSTAEKAKLAAITGTNTGDQDLSALATTAAVAQKANATDVTTSLATKVDKVTGKELSTNDYSTVEKAKLTAITGSNTGDQVNIAGNAATATKLQATVTINGIAFDGSSNVTIPATGAVPYTGATQGLNLGAYDLFVNGLTVGRGKGNIVSNTANGVNALVYNTTGANNTATGLNALVYNTTGYGNTASGSYALYQNTTGSNNTASGYAVLFQNTTGSENTAIGQGALFSNYTGSYNTAIGPGADVSSGALTNATAIGAGAKVNASNTIQLGNTDVTKVITSGMLTAGTVTYPNVHNTIAGQVLTTNAAGVASFTTPAVELPSSGNTAGDMLFWDGAAWVKVSAGSNGQNLTFYNGAPIWVGALSYSYAGATAYANTVLNPKTGKIWMDRNLGATRVAMSSTDAASYGDLYQWGRGTDGHQIRTSLTTPTQSSLDQPGNVNFILGPDTPYDWRSGQNANLWQGINGVNNPCPSGYRLPTDLELAAELASWSSSDPAGAFASPLKLPVAGRRFHFGPLYPENTTGFYWSSTVSGSLSRVLIFSSGYTTMSTNERANGGAVRCIKN